MGPPRRVLLFAISALGASAVTACSEETEPEGAQSQGAVYQLKTWPFKNIGVCWENPTDHDLVYRNLVREVLEEQYAKRTNVSFFGFQKCGPIWSPIIHVRIQDANPYSRYGMESSMPSGMSLNFTFEKFKGFQCRLSKEARLNCIRAYALHEFGHALGLLHEHLRADSTCEGSKYGEKAKFLPFLGRLAGRYDPDSIMNYCENSTQTKKKAVLSKGDIQVINSIYR